MRSRTVQVVLVALGAALVLGHLAALAFLGMTTSSWLSGTVIGLVLAVFGGAHLLLARGPGSSSESRGKQVVFGLIALAVGIAEGLIAVQLRSVGWWLLVPWALTALAIGMLLSGPPVEKAARLSTFGFSSALLVAIGTGEIEGFSGFAIALGWAALGAICAVGVGAAVHTIMSRVHAPVAVD